MSQPQKERRGEGAIAPCVCALAGLFLLVGCETSRNQPDHHWIPIAPSADVIVSNGVSTNRRASPEAIPKRRPVQDLRSQLPSSHYDEVLVDTIEQRWDDLLDHGSLTVTKGLVVLQFTLSWDGNVSDMQLVKNTSSEQAAVICRKAIRDSAPFPAWPVDMRRMVGEKRMITFTFRYER